MTTAEVLNAMIKLGRNGADIYPFMFQPMFGTSNSVSAAIRKGKKEGILEEAGKDGNGNPFYRLAMPGSTHETPAAIQ